jgi:hypothetical protein
MFQNTVDSTGAFRVAVAAIINMSSCSNFLVWNMRKLATIIFDYSVLILDLCLNGYLSS